MAVVVLSSLALMCYLGALTHVLPRHTAAPMTDLYKSNTAHRCVSQGLPSIQTLLHMMKAQHTLRPQPQRLHQRQAASSSAQHAAAAKQAEPLLSAVLNRRTGSLPLATGSSSRLHCQRKMHSQMPAAWGAGAAVPAAAMAAMLVRMPWTAECLAGQYMWASPQEA